MSGSSSLSKSSHPRLNLPPFLAFTNRPLNPGKNFCQNELRGRARECIVPFLKNAGWSSLVARQAHNLKVAGSNPAPATNFRMMALIRDPIS
jgi:hypothetical protein